MKIRLHSTENIFLKYYLYYLFLLGAIFSSINCISIDNYPLIKKLNNGKYIVSSMQNILFLDPTLTQESNIVEIYNSNDLPIIEQFSSENGDYIIVLISDQLYIFSQNETLLYKSYISFDVSNSCKSIIPYSHSGTEYYFFIISKSSSSTLFYINCTYDSLTNLTTLSEEKDFYNLPFASETVSFSCLLMKYHNQNVINFFFGGDDTYIMNFNINENFGIIPDLPEIKINNSEDYYSFFNSIILPGNESVALLCSISTGNYYYCYQYDISLNKIVNQKKINTDECYIRYHQYYFLKYFSQTDEILLGYTYYYSNGKTLLYIIQCTRDLQCSDMKEILYCDYCEYSNTEYTNYPNIVIPSGKNNYYILNYHNNPQNICTDSNYCNNFLFPLNITNNDTIFCPYDYYHNYYHSECLSFIPNGYYCNSSDNRTIDKCHPNCETCTSGQTEDNNNCLTCKNNLFFDSGNCVTERNTSYFEEYNKTISYCSDIKCKNCDEESKQNNLCLSCKIELGFYPKKDDDSNQGIYINCYNYTTISNGYYLNHTTNQYELCYSSCEKCNELGNAYDNKCISCLSGYTFIKNNNNITNCNPICQFFYYFDKNNDYICTNLDICPENYKLINSTNKCIKNCTDDNIYNSHYEYNNTCYDTCPGQSHALNGSYLCIIDTKCDDGYFNDGIRCYESIPEGYYCNSTEFKTIDKCHKNCKTCEKGGTDENNNCLTCKDSEFLDLGNCATSCVNGYFEINNILTCKCSKDTRCNICTEESINKSLCVTCNKELGYYPKINDTIMNDGLIDCYHEPIGYYLKNEIYYPCGSNCKNCVENETANILECTECMEGYIFKNDFDGHKICNKECDYYYYYDSNNNLTCTLDDRCPNDYNKTIFSKKECIDDCSKHKIYKYEYNNSCYEECPPGTTFSDYNKCQDRLDCGESYYNYERTGCIDEIPDGYYCDNYELRTIDKCHENCELCNEGPIDNNNNCLKCKEPLLLEIGNCVTNCTNGLLSNKICKCPLNIKCDSCSEESILLNKCLLCNSDEGYYQKFNDTNNFLIFVNCYSKDTIEDGYYLDSELSLFKPCYETCSKCSHSGDENNHNCEECKSGYLFNNVTKNCEKEECENYFYFDDSNKYHCTDNNICPSNYNKLIINKKRCIDDCKKDDTYKYEYENQCYINCPESTEPNENNVCITAPTEKVEQIELVCPEEYPYELVNSKKCIKDCNATDLLNNICKINNPIAKDRGTTNIKSSITDGSLNDVIDNITKTGEDLIIDEKDIKYQITTTSNQNNNSQSNNISTIKLGECENILKNIYNISKDNPLLIFKIDAKVEGFSSTVVEYEVYHPITKKQLNLTYCQNTSIEIQVPVSIDEEEVYKYDPSSEYYTDICTTSTSDSGTDIILSDRQSEYVNNNLSLCENSCTFNGYDRTTKKAICECNVKTSITDISKIKIDKEKFFEGFLDLKSLINISIMKCYKLLFSKEGFSNNIGNYLLLPIIAYNAISSLLFYLKGYNLLKNQINQMIDNLKEYENDVNLTDKNVKIYENKLKRIKKKKKTKKNKKSKKTQKNPQNDNIINNNNIYQGIINQPPKRSNAKRKTTSVYANNNYSDSLNTFKNNITNKIFSKDPTMKINSIDNNNNLVMNEKLEPKPEEKIEKKTKTMEFYNDFELNSLEYKEALEIDKRTYFQYYISLIKKKQLIIFTFYPTNDYNSMIIKICLLLFSFVLYYTVNALFFNDSTMHKIYEDQGAFNFLYHIPQILYSTIISSVINIIVKKLSLSENNVLEIKKEKNSENVDKKKQSVLKCLTIKFTLFFIVCILFIIFFWYYLACFCAVYKNTQYYLIKDTLLSFCLSLLYPFGLNLLPGILRIPSLKNNNKECIYKISKIVQII